VRLEKFLRRIIERTLNSDTAHRPELKVLADSGHIEPGIDEPGDHARDAMPTAAPLTITSGIRELDEGFRRFHGFGRPGRYAVVSVSDTGVGMDENMRDKIFEPFLHHQGDREGHRPRSFHRLRDRKTAPGLHRCLQ